MGLLEDVFCGSNGVTNMLLDLLGTEVTAEFEFERVYREGTDTSLADVQRRKVPAVVTRRGFFVSAANLGHWVISEKTRVHLNKRVYQVLKAVPLYAGGIVHAWDLEVIEI